MIAGTTAPFRAQRKIVPAADLSAIRAEYPDKKIVLCHGAFDLVHMGHLIHFEDARSLGDILVVTSKIVSKADGRVMTGDREAAIDAEAVRVVARRGPTRIVQNRNGLVLAAAGVDNSNTAPGPVVLLPTDPDESARQLRRAIADRRGISVGVIISDTLGRAWRTGQTDTAIGAAGLAPLRDHRGEPDTFGTVLEVTVSAVADEIAGAADLVQGKTEQVPVAVVRGLPGLVTDGVTVSMSRDELMSAALDASARSCPVSRSMSARLVSRRSKPA